MSKAHPPKKYTFVASKGSFQKVNAKNIWNFPYVGWKSNIVEIPNSLKLILRMSSSYHL